MDPITAINLEFAREVKEDWLREAAGRRSEHPALAPRAGAVDRLRALVGTGLIAVGTWLKAPTRPMHAGQ